MIINKTACSLAVLLAAATTFGAPPSQAPAVLVEKATLKSDISAKKYVGHIEAIEKVSIQARISGILEKIKFTEGEIVKKGQLLFVIEDTTYRAKAEAARAAVSQVEATLIYAQHDFARKKSLLAKNAVSEVVYDDAERSLKTAEAKLREAKATLLDCENSLSYTKIYAPITGRISKCTYTAGNYVTPSSQQLANIVQASPIYVRFALSERDFQIMFGSAVNMRKLATVNLNLPGGKRYSKNGKVTLVDNVVDNETGTITAWATFDNPDEEIIAGGFATVNLGRGGQIPRPAITRTALQTDGDGQYIWIVQPDNKIARRNVVPGSIAGQWQLINDGLKAGETVVIDGTHKARNGITVNPVFAGKQK